MICPLTKSDAEEARKIAASAAKKTSSAPDPGAAETEVSNPSWPLGPGAVGVRDDPFDEGFVLQHAFRVRTAERDQVLGAVFLFLRRAEHTPFFFAVLNIFHTPRGP